MSLVFRLALPDDEDPKALLPQLGNYASVSCDVRFELRSPERRIVLRRSGAATSLVAVPEAAMNEDGPPTSSVRDVRTSGQVPIRNAIAKTELGDSSPNRELGGRALLPDSAHPGGGGRVDVQCRKRCTL